jgi:hypothetical protein
MSLLPLFALAVPLRAVSRDSEIIPIWIKQPEITQAPFLHLNIGIKFPAILDDPISLSFQVVDFKNNLEPLRWFSVRCLCFGSLRRGRLDSANENPVSLDEQVSTLMLSDLELEDTDVKFDTALDVRWKDLNTQ